MNNKEYDDITDDGVVRNCINEEYLKKEIDKRYAVEYKEIIKKEQREEMKQRSRFLSKKCSKYLAK